MAYPQIFSLMESLAYLAIHANVQHDFVMTATNVYVSAMIRTIRRLGNAVLPDVVSSKTLLYFNQLTGSSIVLSLLTSGTEIQD